MDILIDANIIRRDLKLKDKNFEILSDYLKKTDSKLIYPSIVLEEIKGLYKRALNDKFNQYRSIHRKLSSTLIETKIPEFPIVDIEKESNKYIEFLHSNLNTTKENIIDYKNEFLPELVKRAIERKKPLDGKGQQFRDGLLWLTLLDYAKNSKDKRIAFISDNPSDFAEKGENKLCADLLKETLEAGVEVIYFKTLADFAKEHASFIEFMTKEWIEKEVDFKIIKGLFEELVDNIDDDNILDDVVLENNEKTTGHLQQTGWLNSSLIDFYVYEKEDGIILLNAEWEFETEFEFEIERVVERDLSRYENRYTVNPKTGEPEMDMIYIPDYNLEPAYIYKYEYPIIRVKYIITIENKKVKDYDLKEWHWG